MLFRSTLPVIAQVRAILAAMTGNVNYPNPTPALPVLTAGFNEFSTAVANAADGGVTLTSIKNDRRQALVMLVRALACYVQAACNGDLTILLESGFPVHKPTRSPIGALPTPANLTVTLGTRSGELDASAAPVPGAATYNWQLKAASTPTVVLQTAQTTAASKTFTGLTPGVVYLAEVNATGTAGPSDWSDAISQMVV